MKSENSKGILLSDTLVKTDNGYKFISEIRENDKISTDRGYVSVLHVLKKEEEE